MELILSLWRPLMEIIFIWLLVYYVIRFFEGTRIKDGAGIVAAFNIASFSHP
jgi:hypothetical protein